MKIEDLMIGDWVMRVGIDDPRPVKVTAVNGIKHYVLVDDPKSGCSGILLYAGDIEGIGITQEVMEELGFKYQKRFYFKRFGSILCNIHHPALLVDVLTGYTDVALYCKSGTAIHELQHMLKLAGLELEADAWAKQSTPQQLNTSTIDN